MFWLNRKSNKNWRAENRPQIFLVHIGTPLEFSIFNMVYLTISPWKRRFLFKASLLGGCKYYDYDMTKWCWSSNVILVPGCLRYIGDEILPFYMGIIVNHYKDPYEATNIMESKRIWGGAHVLVKEEIHKKHMESWKPSADFLGTYWYTPGV